MTQADTELATEILAAEFPEAIVGVSADYLAALAACGEDAVCVVAGTGSLVCSQVGDEILKTGGRGYLFGDFGSAYRYGWEFVRHYLELDAVEDRAIEKCFGVSTPSEVLSTLYRGGPIAPKLARLAPSFGEAVKRRESFATEFLASETARLAEQILVHLQMKDRPVKLAGGLWKSSPVYEIALRKAMPGAAVSRLGRPPVEGAVILARGLVGAHKSVE
jgi:N-acetylglucosamine kinase-like BadF-type ATPase